MKRLLLSFSFLTSIFGFGQYTYVPDDNFEQALIDLGYDEVLDDYVLSSHIEFVQNLDVSFLNISDLTGIEDFLHLEGLSCTNNDIINLDLSQNLNLRSLTCYNNNLTYLDMSHNIELKSLLCMNNNLTFLDLSKCTELNLLDCSDNQLTNLDVSHNINLTRLYFHNNLISNIELSQNLSLIHLFCFNNNLQNININSNTELISFNCGGNQLSSLGLFNNINLRYLTVDNNQLKNLDLSNNINLEHFTCTGNQLTTLNVKNGNNSNMVEIDGVQGFSSINNPNLFCIQVDDAAWSETNWTSVDEWTSFSEDCNYMNVHEEDLTQISIYPNPVKDILNFSEQLIEISIYDVSGKMVLSQHNTTNQINLTSLPKGNYLVKGITISGKNFTQKFIKK